MRDKLTVLDAREGRDPTRFERAALEREAAADTRSHKTGAAVTDLRTRWVDEAAEVGVTPSQLIAEIQAAARANPDPDEKLSMSEVLMQSADRRSTWHRMDVLRTICDATSPQPGIDGTKWMAELDRAVDEVLAQCVALDPPTEGARRRNSDGRSVWLPPVTTHMTSEQVILEEDAIITWAIECSTVRPSPSQTIEVGQLDMLQAEAAASVSGSWRRIGADIAHVSGVRGRDSACDYRVSAGPGVRGCERYWDARFRAGVCDGLADCGVGRRY